MKRKRINVEAEPEVFKKPRKVVRSVESVDDLIKLGFQYNIDDPIYGSDFYKNLFKIIPPLMELQNMIGLTKIKKKIIDQIIYFIQDLHIRDSESGNHFLNTYITGAPGTGKTTIATIIGKIYFHLGFLPSSQITYAKRTDFLANYLGQTANKTLKFLKEATPGILIIDEVYSLGNEENRDSFAKEAIDTINQYLSEHKGELICIIMGYKRDIETCFFNYNQGLRRRFPFSYDIDDYSANDLKDIFASMITRNNWKMEVPLSNISAFFHKNKEKFTENGGDIENLIFYCKNAHSLNLFIERLNGIQNRHKFHLNNKDIENGFEKFIQDVVQRRNTELPLSVEKMYS